MQQNKTILLFLFLGAVTILPESAYARCNTCSDYNIACVNETSFVVCVDGEPQPDITYDCPNEKICTSQEEKCVDKDIAEPTCGRKAECGVCEQDNLFACVSRTKFILCNGSEDVKSSSKNCPTGFVCDSTQAEICVEESDHVKPSCDQEEV